MKNLFVSWFLIKIIPLIFINKYENVRKSKKLKEDSNEGSDAEKDNDPIELESIKKKIKKERKPRKSKKQKGEDDIEEEEIEHFEDEI